MKRITSILALVGLFISTGTAISAPADGRSRTSPSSEAGGDGFGPPRRWKIEQIDAEGAVPSIQIDVRGAAHVAYFHPKSGSMRYATEASSGRWRLETVAAARRPGTQQYLWLDRSSTPHIVYLAPDGHLMHASRASGAWTQEKIALASDLSNLVVGVADASDRIHVLYRDQDQLHHTVQDGHGWSSPSTMSIYYPGPIHAIAAGDRVFLGANDDSDFKYAVFENGEWTYSDPLGAGGGDGVVVALDQLDLPVVALVTEDGLSIGRRDGAAWSFQPISQETGDPVAIGFDRKGRMHLVYWTAEGLRYFTDQSARGAFETLSRSSRTASMAIDEMGGVHVAFDDQGVRLARLQRGNGNGGLEVTQVDPAADPSRAHRLAAWPLPLRGEALSVEFAAKSSDDVDLAIFDTGGRRVRTILQGRFAPGNVGARWDGRNDQGSTAPTGVYYLRLRAGGAMEQLKIVRL